MCIYMCVYANMYIYIYICIINYIYISTRNLTMVLISSICFGHMSNECVNELFRHVYAQVTRAALEAGKRRRELALSVAATSASSGSSGKRSHKSVAATPSTHVTPEPKQSHTEVPPAEPCALTFTEPPGGGVILFRLIVDAV